MQLFLSLFVTLLTLSAKADVSLERNYSDVIRYLYGISKSYPQTATVFTLGYSDEGKAIEGLKIGSGPVSHLVVAAHHGNEVPSTEVALNFAESMAKNPIPGMTVYVVPVLNINGYDARSRYERVAGQKLDLNRDYPGPCGSEGPFKSRSTRALADFVAQNRIVAAATLHTYKPTVAYPWGNSAATFDTLYNSVFEELAMAATIESHYEIGFSGITMYPADGTFEDYVFWKNGVYSLLFEVGASNRPTPEELQDVVWANVVGLREMLRVAPRQAASEHEFTNGCAWGALDLHAE